MSYSILNLKQDLTGVLHQTELNQITNLDGVIDRAARQLLLDLDPQETKRTLEFVTPIYNSVFDYPIADDVKGNRIIDIRPQVQRLPADIWGQAYNQAFDVAKQNILSMTNMFTMNFNTGIKTIRVNAPYLNAPVIINQIEAVATNGTWATGGTASGLEVNNTNFVQGAGSLQFNATTGAAYLENSDMSPVDLSNYENQAPFFVNVYVPTGADLTSVDLRVGSSASDYYTRTVTVNQPGNAFQNGWNLCQFDWAGITPVGSPDASSISYARVTLNLTANATACKLNGLNNILGSILEYEYYSKFLFRNAITGAFQEKVLDDSDLINLDTETYNLLFNKVTEFAVQQQQGMDALAYDGTYFKGEYDRGVAKYKLMYKSEVQKPQTTYYAKPIKGYNKFPGRFYN